VIRGVTMISEMLCSFSKLLAQASLLIVPHAWLRACTHRPQQVDVLRM
jgi:hypothetical protein